MALSNSLPDFSSFPAAGGLLVPRADATCGGISGLSQCAGSFPTSFCCPSSSTCFPFSDNQAVICCPNGSNCEGIAPTSCDVQFYNATAHPESPMHLSDLTTQPKQCGTACCPAGYTCNAKNFCVLNSLVSATAAATSTATAATVTGTVSSSPATASATTTSTSTSANGAAAACPQSSSSCPTFPLSAVLVGLGAGLVGGVLITLFFIWCIGWRAQRKQNRPADDDSSLGPVAAKVSDPIYMGAGATRTDFLRFNSKSRRSPGGSSNNSARRSPTTLVSSAANSPAVSRVRSLFSRTPTMAARERWERMSDDDNNHANQAFPEGGRQKEMAEVRTPERQIRREPSTESIKIYSPPDARGLDRLTTFGDMVKAAGATPEDRAPAVPPLNFMGSPGMVDPRARGVDGGKLK